MWKLGVEEWKFRFALDMHADAAPSLSIYNNFSEKLGVKVGVHQGSALSPLVFVIVIEALL